jgi:group I intron endonuclease
MVIYITINLVNGKKYIGRDSKNNPNYYGSGPAIKNAIKKYGKQNFKKEIIEHCENINHLMERERYWLNYYNAGNDLMFYNLNNLSSGGSLPGEKNYFYGKHHSSEAKQKIRESKIGKTHSDETRKKLRISHTGKKLSTETKQKLSLAKKGRVFSDEHKKKLSRASTGEKNHMYGKTHSEERKQIMRERMAGEKNPMYGKGYRCVGEKNGNFKGYILCIEGKYKGQRKTASEWTHIFGKKHPACICSHLSGRAYKNGIDGNFLKWEHDI